MGDGIDFDPSVAADIRKELAKGLETVRRQAASFEGLARSLETSWRDESASDVAELIRKGNFMYGAVADQILEVQSHLDELERIYNMHRAAEAAQRARTQQMRDETAGKVAEQVRSQGLMNNQEYWEQNPDELHRHSSIGPDRYR